MKKYFVYVDDVSYKFWEIEVKEKVLIVRFGKVGTKGQINEKKFNSEDDAIKEAEKLITSKIQKGYREEAGSKDEDFLKELWITELDKYYIYLNNKLQKNKKTDPLGIIIIEWDYEMDYDLIEKNSDEDIENNDYYYAKSVRVQIITESYDSLEEAEKNNKKYSGVSDLVIDEDYFFTIERDEKISSKNLFITICKEMLKLESFKKINIFKEIFIKCQQHDTKINYNAKLLYKNGIVFKIKVDENEERFKGSDIYREMKSLWDRFEKCLIKNDSMLVKNLKPGLPLRKIEKIEKEMKFNLPDDLKASVMIHDGQNTEPVFCGLIGNWLLNDLFWMHMNRWDWSYKPLIDTVPTDGKIKNDWWNMKWLPLVHNFVSTSDYPDEIAYLICLDLDPTDEGEVGQIFLFMYDKKKRYVIAKSYKEWFQTIVENLESGTFKIIKKHEDDQKIYFMYFNVEGFLL